MVSVADVCQQHQKQGPDVFNFTFSSKSSVFHKTIRRDSWRNIVDNPSAKHSCRKSEPALAGREIGTKYFWCGFQELLLAVEHCDHENTEESMQFFEILPTISAEQRSFSVQISTSWIWSVWMWLGRCCSSCQNWRRRDSYFILLYRNTLLRYVEGKG